MINLDENCTIMIVDDSSTARVFIKKTFEKAGFTNKNFIMAGDGQQALDKLTGENINLIVTDLVMPYIDGHELIKRVKAMPSHGAIPIIVATSSSNPAKEEELIAAGAAMVLTKPIEPEALLEAWTKARAKMYMKNEKILILKNMFTDVLNAMASINLTDTVMEAKIEDSFLEDSRQVTISTFKPSGYKFILTVKSALLKKLASIICDIKAGDITDENEKETLSELLNTAAGAFMKKITPSEQTFELNLPVPTGYPLSSEGIINCAFKIKDNIYVVLSMVEPLALR